MSDAGFTPAVTVTYEPDCAWPERLRSILAACPRCIVVDNSLTPAARIFVAATVAANPGAELIANPDNPGIGCALNQGFAVLHTAGHRWAIAFDQDSTPSPTLAENLLAAVNTTDRGTIAVVGSNWFDPARPDHVSLHLVSAASGGFGFCRVRADVDLPNVLCVITSGSLFSLPAWARIGGFDESLFLDLVDTDFCLRARRAGLRICVSAAATLSHHRGSKRLVRVFGRPFHPAFIPPSRLHNMSRNRIRLFKKHSVHEPAWVAYELTYTLKLTADILFLEDHKLLKIAACIQGTLEALADNLPARSPRIFMV